MLQVYPKVTQKIDIDEIKEKMCPFCENRYAIAKPDKISNPLRDPVFGIDDGLECIFVDPEKLKLPAKGVV